MADAAEKGVRLDAWAYSSLMKGHVRAQELPEAMLLLGEMDRRGVAPTVVRPPSPSAPLPCIRTAACQRRSSHGGAGGLRMGPSRFVLWRCVLNFCQGCNA